MIIQRGALFIIVGDWITAFGTKLGHRRSSYLTAALVTDNFGRAWLSAFDAEITGILRAAGTGPF